MKKFALLTAVVVLIFTASSNLIWAQVDMPPSSPRQHIVQQFGLGNIEVVYSRPQSKNRQVFGDLVPNGKLWRTGANEATLITFSDAVEIDGKNLDAGTYALYTIPNEEGWEIIINKGVKNWGTEGYQENDDVLRIKTEPVKSKINVETFTIQISNIKKESCVLQLLWAKKIINIPITTDIKEKLRQQITAAFQTNDKPYWQAAQFYFEYDRNLSKALENISKAIEVNQQAYWMHLYKANIQKEMGDYPGALKSSITSLELSEKAANEDYVKMNKKLQKELKK